MLKQIEENTPPQNTRLRRTDFFETAHDVIVDEQQTVEVAGIHADELFILEIGKVYLCNFLWYL